MKEVTIKDCIDKVREISERVDRCIERLDRLEYEKGNGYQTGDDRSY